jgi:hypothetical protein
MYARTSTLGILAAMALGLPSNPARRFTLDTTGAVALTVAGEEAQYGLIPAEVNGFPMLTISLGATNAQGSLVLSASRDQLPTRGRYPIGSNAFHAGFVAGSPERPLGWFHGESGWVEITEAAAGRMSGRFEIRARGFLSADPDNENRWVTVRGTFEAHSDSAEERIP